MSLESAREADEPSEQPAQEQAAAAAAEEDDEFGGFDEFAEFEGGAEPAQTAPAEAAELASPVAGSPAHSDAPEPVHVPVLASSEIGAGAGVEDKVRRLLVPPPARVEVGDGDGGTSTSHQLWHVLTEPSWVPVPDWNGSRVHKRLAVSLGVPLNLDASLPKVATRHMVLPTTSEESVEGMQKVPEWSLLALVSPEALHSMTGDELGAHTATLAAALAAAEELKDAMESQEMDLLGEKNILEGMVESLLAYSQRNQRESLLRKASKSRR